MRLIAAVGVLPTAPAGPERMITQMIRALRAADPDLAPTLRASTLRRGDQARAAMHRIDPGARHSVTTLPPRLSQALRMPPERLMCGRFDVYHQFHLDTDPAVPSRQLVVSLNDLVALDWPGDEGVLARRATRLLRRAARVLAISSYSRGDAIDRLGLDPDRVEVVHIGVDHDLFRPGEPAADGPARFVYVGGSTPRKNVGSIISALHAVRHDTAGRDARLILAGPVAAAEARLRAAAPAGLDGSALEFAGHLDDDALAALYRTCTAVVYPSLAEGFGLPVLEAMASGTPVVTSTTTSLPEVGGDAAIYVDPTDVDQIAAGMLRAVGGSERERSGRRAAGLAQAARFTWDDTARRVAAVYRSLDD